MKIKIALAGNPNCGKTTLFNDITGSSQKIGNWPGVTVEKVEGNYKGAKDVQIIDLPGIYSLSPYTLEEVVTRNYLINDDPDVVLNIIDGTNLERNMYLTTQLVEIGVPMVIAVNMIDIVNKRGDVVNLDEIKKAFGCEVVEMSALKGTGVKAAMDKAIEIANSKKMPEPKIEYSEDVKAALTELEALVPEKYATSKKWFATKLFDSDKKLTSDFGIDAGIVSKGKEIADKVAKKLDDDAESIMVNERYDFINTIIGKCLSKQEKGLSVSDKVDKIVTNRILGLPIFVLVMFAIYKITFVVGQAGSDYVNDNIFGDGYVPTFLNESFEKFEVAGWLQGLVVDGIEGGVGAVLGFLPLIIVLYFFMGILEDLGYMARVAFVMDRIFRKFGLSGKSFIPMLISTGCGIPGVMATKTIENEKDRRMTIMTSTFMPCGAKMPIIALFAAAVFNDSTIVAPAMFLIAMAVIIMSGIILKKTKLFAGDPAPFVMELPSYHVPAFKNVLLKVWERVKAFAIKAGTIILITAVLLWFLKGFGYVDGKFGMLEEDQLDHSLLATIGNAFAWIFAPLGFATWKSAVATVTGLIAKEDVVGTFGVLLGEEFDEENVRPLAVKVAEMFGTREVAVSFMLFNLLSAPCFAAIGAIKKQMGSAKWTWAAILWMTAMAYFLSFVTYQFMHAATAGFSVLTGVAVVLTIGFLYLLFRRNKYVTHTNEKLSAK